MNKIMSAIKDLTTQTQDVLCAEHSTGQIYFPLILDVISGIASASTTSVNT